MLLNGSLLRHDGTKCRCLHGEPTYQLKEAFQVRNRTLWRRYQNRSRRIVEKNKELGIGLEKMKPPVGDALAEFGEELLVEWGQNEEILFHGTRTWEDAKKIVARASTIVLHVKVAYTEEVRTSQPRRARARNTLPLRGR